MGRTRNGAQRRADREAEARYWAEKEAEDNDRLKLAAQIDESAILRFEYFRSKGDVEHFPVTKKLTEYAVTGISLAAGHFLLSADGESGYAILTPDELDALADEFKALAEMAREAV